MLTILLSEVKPQQFSFIVVLTWAVYSLAVNPDIQVAARQEVKRVCSDTGDITADDIDNMKYVPLLIIIIYIYLYMYVVYPNKQCTRFLVITLAEVLQILNFLHCKIPKKIMYLMSGRQLHITSNDTLLLSVHKTGRFHLPLAWIELRGLSPHPQFLALSPPPPPQCLPPSHESLKYTVSQITKMLDFCLQLCQTLTDFQNSFTVRFTNKFVIQ